MTPDNRPLKHGHKQMTPVITATHELNAKIVDWGFKGMTAADVCKCLHVSKTKVTKLFNMHGVPKVEVVTPKKPEPFVTVKIMP